MEATTLLLFVVIFTAALLLFPRNANRARIVRLVDRLPGPPSYPIVGSLLPYILAHRKGT